MLTPAKYVPIMNETEARNGSRRFVAVIIFLMFITIATMASAITLSVFADTTLLIRAADSSTVEQPTQVGNSIEKLWQGFFSSLSALIGLLGGKVL